MNSTGHSTGLSLFPPSISLLSFNDAQAESIVQVFTEADEQVATKHDIELLRRDLTLKIVTSSIGTVVATVTILRFLIGGHG